MTLPSVAEMRTIGVPVVHAVTTDEIVNRPDFIDVACSVMRVLGPRGALHLRASHLTGARLQSLAEGLGAAQGLTGGWLIVNDRIDIALVAGARGVQLTSRSLATSDARKVAPALAIGASVHDAEEGRLAIAGGADWLVAAQASAAGRTRHDAFRIEGWVRALARSTSVPLIAIGGVRIEHVGALREMGIHGIAVIRGIWDASNAEQAASDYLSAYDHVGA
ncbi:MAG: thiamine phosphate synthase [Gemmatimonadota bacterium]|nr:thiamine phosphate synthase [Gemmatimonadota bacterium]